MRLRPPSWLGREAKSGRSKSMSAVHYAVTVPDVYECAVAFMAEFDYVFLMVNVLFSNSQQAGALHSIFCWRTDRDVLPSRNRALRQ